MEAGHLIDDNLNSMIGTGTRFKGEFELEGLLRVDGDFSGVIRTSGKVIVGRSGRVECTMYVGRVVIAGIVRGDIHSKEMVTILSSGMVIGNISTPRLIVEEGVVFNGSCTILRGGQEIEQFTENEPEYQAESRGFGGNKQTDQIPPEENEKQQNDSFSDNEHQNNRHKESSLSNYQNYQNVRNSFDNHDDPVNEKAQCSPEESPGSKAFIIGK